MGNFTKLHTEEFFLILHLPSQEGKVLTALLKYATNNKDSKEANNFRFRRVFPSKERLVSFSGLSARSINRGLKGLQKKNLITIEIITGVNYYTIHYPIGIDNVKLFLNSQDNIVPTQDNIVPKQDRTVLKQDNIVLKNGVDQTNNIENNDKKEEEVISIRNIKEIYKNNKYKKEKNNNSIDMEKYKQMLSEIPNLSLLD
tara:strand:- start:160 stop:759 length:600 start_codon:yes stop_codon:yes gene_type:complete